MTLLMTALFVILNTAGERSRRAGINDGVQFILCLVNNCIWFSGPVLIIFNHW